MGLLKPRRCVIVVTSAIEMKESATVYLTQTPSKIKRVETKSSKKNKLPLF